MATHSTILAWEIPWTEEPWRLQSMEAQKSWTQLSNLTTTNVCMSMALSKFVPTFPSPPVSTSLLSMSVSLLLSYKWVHQYHFLESIYIYIHALICCCSVNKSCLLSETPWTAAHQVPCPSPTPGAYSNPCPLSR